MEDARRLTLGAALDEAWAAATLDWCRNHAQGLARDEAFALALKSATVSILWSGYGKVNFTVTVSGRRRDEDEVYFWRFKRHTNGTLQPVGGTIDL